MVGSCDAAPALESSMGSLIRVVDTVGESEDHQDGIKRIAGLPAEIVDIIFARVGFRNIMRSSITCKRWYSFVISKTGCETPWLMLQDKSLDEHQFTVRFVSLWGEQDSQCRDWLDIRPCRTSEIPRLAFELSCITSSADGWLLFGCNFYGHALERNFLWLYNPFNKARVQLPPYSPPPMPPARLYNHGRRSYQLRRSNLRRRSYDGVDNPPQCLVFSSSQFSCDFVVLISGYYLALCKLYGTQWVYFRNPRKGQYEHILFWKEEQLVCAIDAAVDSRPVVDVFMLVDSGNGEVGLGLVKSVPLKFGSEISFRRLHLVESLGNVLVVLFVNAERNKDVRVYKLSLSERPRRMQSLDGEPLFVGVRCPAFSVAAKDFPQLKENSIYFANLSHVNVFTLKDNGVVTKTTYDPKYGLNGCPIKQRMVRLVRPGVRKINQTTRTKLSLPIDMTNHIWFNNPPHH